MILPKLQLNQIVILYEPYNERVRRGGRMRERPGQNRSGGGDLGRNRARPKPPGDGKWTSSCKSSVGAAALGGLSSGTGRGPVRGFYAGEGLCPGLSAGSLASLGKRAGTKARPCRRYCRVRRNPFPPDKMHERSGPGGLPPLTFPDAFYIISLCKFVPRGPAGLKTGYRKKGSV